MTRPFIVFAMPRARSAWLSAFLTYGDWVCVHEMSVAFRQLSDLDKILGKPRFGICDTQLALCWPEVIGRWPQARLVVLRRPKAEVIKSCAALGWQGPMLERAIDRLCFALDEVSALKGVLQTTFQELKHEDAARRVFEQCLPCRWDPAWWEFTKDLNIQIQPEILMERARSNVVGMDRVFGKAQAYYDSRVLQ
jgi:hypothetical protein